MGTNIAGLFAQHAELFSRTVGPLAQFGNVVERVLEFLSIEFGSEIFQFLVDARDILIAENGVFQRFFDAIDTGL